MTWLKSLWCIAAGILASVSAMCFAYVLFVLMVCTVLSVAFPFKKSNSILRQMCILMTGLILLVVIDIYIVFTDIYDDRSTLLHDLCFSLLYNSSTNNNIVRFTQLTFLGMAAFVIPFGYVWCLLIVSKIKQKAGRTTKSSYTGICVHLITSILTNPALVSHILTLLLCKENTDQSLLALPLLTLPSKALIYPLLLHIKTKEFADQVCQLQKQMSDMAKSAKHA